VPEKVRHAITAQQYTGSMVYLCSVVDMGPLFLIKMWIVTIHLWYTAEQ